MPAYIARLTLALLIATNAVGFVGSDDVSHASFQPTGVRYSPENVISSPSSATLRRGESIDFTITATSSELPPFLTLELDNGLEIVGEAVCGVDIFAYPLGSGPEKSRWIYRDCTGGWLTDLTTGITTMEAGVPNPNMSAISHSVVITMEVKVSQSATPGDTLNIKANERLSIKSIATISVQNETAPSKSRTTPINKTGQTETAKTLPNHPFVDEEIEAAPGDLVRFDLEPELNPLGGAVQLELLLPAGIELIGAPSCESTGLYTCAGKIDVQEHDDGSISVRWRLSGLAGDQVNITVAIRIGNSELPDTKLTIVALLSRATSSNTPTSNIESELVIHVVDED